MERWVVNVTPRPLYPPKMARYPFYRRLGGAQGRPGRVRKISPQPGFNPRTVQPTIGILQTQLFQTIANSVHDTTLSSLPKPHVNYRHLSRSTVYIVHSHFTIWRLQCNGCCYTSHWHSKSRICRHVKTTGVATIQQRYARHKTYTYRGPLSPLHQIIVFALN